MSPEENKTVVRRLVEAQVTIGRIDTVRLVDGKVLESWSEGTTSACYSSPTAQLAVRRSEAGGC